MGHKKILSILLFAIVTLMICGCGYDMYEIYSTDADIAQENDTFDLNDSSQNIDGNNYFGEYKLDGYGLIWNYISDEEKDIKAKYYLNVKNGKAKIVFIDDNDNVTTLVENTNESEYIGNASLNINIKKGLNRIKVVGYKAEMDVSLSIDEGEFMTIGVDK